MKKERSTKLASPQSRRPQGGGFSQHRCSHHWVYHNLMQSLDVGVILLDTVRKVVAYQNACSRSLLSEDLDPGDFQALTRLLGLEGEVAGQERRKTLRLGNRLLGYSIYAIAEKGCWIILLRDMTEKARLMSIAEAVNTMDNISYIFSGIRNEIGNPINSIKMTLSVLRRNLGRFSRQEIREYIDRTLGEVSRVEDLLKSLKNFSMFENLAVEGVDLTLFLRRFSTLVRNDLERDGIRLSTRLPEDTVWGMSDPRALQQGMLNLLTNATIALRERDNPQVHIDLQVRDGLIWITLSDNGCGISTKDRQHLFKPFYSTKPGGSGLGLVITRKMLAQMNIGIEIQSEENVGTTVTLSIPEAGGANAKKTADR